MEKINLKQIDQIDILTLQDNYIDLTSQDSTEIIQRALPLKGMAFANSIKAEHGFSTMVTVSADNNQHTLLFDFGFSSTGAYENSQRLNQDLSQVEILALSHGHMDHLGGFKTFVKHMDRKDLSLILHPAAFKKNRVNKITDDFKVIMPMLTKEEIKNTGVKLIETVQPYPIFDESLYFIGEIPKTNEFEKGSASFYYEENGKEEWDPLNDDSALIAHIKGKGLIILTGCAHSGIINTVKYAQKITGIDKIHVIMGGFHLSGLEFAPIIDKTIESLKDLNPDYIVPTHCTGRKVMTRIEMEMEEKHLLNMAGTRMVFKRENLNN